MKRLFLTALLGVLLTGCASSGKPEDNKLNTGNSWFTAVKDADLAGDFPVYYMDVIRKELGKNVIPEFAPRVYINATHSGWLACYKDEVKKQRYAISIKDDRIVYNLSRASFVNLDKACDGYKLQQDKDWLKRGDYYQKELDRLSADPKKNDLFGKYPEHPLIIAKSYMLRHLNDPLSAEYKDLKITKTYYTDEDYQLKFGYLLTLKINSKGRYDQMEGFKVYYLTVKDNIVVDHLKSSLADEEMQKFTK